MGSSFQVWLCARSAKLTFIVLISVSIRVDLAAFRVANRVVQHGFSRRNLGIFRNIDKDA
jgi:hypothetical protein